MARPIRPVSCWTRLRWNNFENWSTFVKVHLCQTSKSLLFWNTVYMEVVGLLHEQLAQQPQTATAVLSVCLSIDSSTAAEPTNVCVICVWQLCFSCSTYMLQMYTKTNSWKRTVCNKSIILVLQVYCVLLLNVCRNHSEIKQEAQLSQRGRTMPRVVEYFG